MSLRTLTRAAAVACVACLGTATWLTVTAGSSGALEREGMVIGENEVVEAAFGPIVGSNPAGQATGVTECRTSAYCDTIPLEVIPPASVAADEEYFVQILLDWETESEPVLDTAVNDLDLYIYTDPDTPEEAVARGHSPDSETNPYVASSTSATATETAYLFKPRGNYSMMVINWLGANTGYTISLTWVSEAFPTPFEALAPEFAPSTTTTTTTTTTAPTTTTTTVAPPPTLATAEIDVDDEFDLSQFDTDEFEEDLAAPAPIVLAPIASEPDPPSDAALLFWLLAVPFGAMAVGGTWVLRNRATI